MTKEPTKSDFARLLASRREAVTDCQATRDRYWLTRHYIAISTLVTFAIAATTPHSLNARAIEAAGPVSWWVIGVLAIVSAVVLFEAFVSAFVSRIPCEQLRRRRHTLYMGIAVGQLCLGYAVVVYAPSSSGLLLRLCLDATAAALVAFLDLFARHKTQGAYA